MNGIKKTVATVDLQALIAGLDMTTLADEWDAKNAALKAFKDQADKPEAPAKPEPVATGVPVVCGHKGKGGMWLECNTGLRGDQYRQPDEPKTTLTLVDDDGVIRIVLDFKQLEALSVEITRVLDEHDQAERGFQAWRTAQAKYEDARQAWAEMSDKVGSMAREAYRADPNAGSAVERDDDEYDEDDEGRSDAADLPF